MVELKLSNNPRQHSNYDFVGATLYPSPTAGDGKYVRGNHPKKVNDSYGCSQCGFQCSIKRVKSPGGSSEGNGGITVSVSSEVGDPTVSGSVCPHCGSANSRG